MEQARVRSRLSMLFFSQVCLLAAVAGVLAFRYPGPGFLLLAFVWLLDLPRSGTPGRVFLIALAFVGAVGYAYVCEPLPPPVPGWLAEASAPSRLIDGKEKPPPAERIRARVVEVAPRSGDRLRIILEHVTPIDGEAGETGRDPSFSAPYQGLIAWTWYKPEFVPLPGRTIETTVRLAAMRGTNNPGVWEIDRYWGDRNVWFRAWSGGRAGAVMLEPDSPQALPGGRVAAALAGARQNLLDKFLAALPGQRGPTGQAPKALLAEAAAMLPALVFGDRSLISTEQSDLVARSTLAHSLALSGLHLGYAVLAGLVLAHGLGWCFPRLWLRLSRPMAALLLALPLAAGYLWLGGMPLSLLRAACMLLFWASLLFLKRPKALLDGLTAAAATLLLLDPLYLFDLGLQLSILSVATIAVCLPSLSALVRRIAPYQPAGPESLFVGTGARAGIGAGAGPLPASGFFAAAGNLLRRCLHGAAMLLGVSFCIQIALLPLTLRAFGTSGLCFPLNLIWLPVLGALVMPAAFFGLAFAGLGLETPAALALHFAALPCEALMALLHWMDTTGLLLAPLSPRPHWLSAAGFWLLFLSLPALIRGRAVDGRRRLTALFVLGGAIMLLLPPALAAYDNRRPGVRLRLLDVGQGQSALVEWSGLTSPGTENAPLSGRVIVDGGGFAGDGFDVGKSIVAPALTDNALPRLDAIINTHPDVDHLAGLVYLLENFHVGQYLTNGDRAVPALEQREQAALDKNGLSRRVMQAGDSLELAPDLRLEALWPEGPEQREPSPPGGEKGNNASLVLRLVWRGKGLALLCGDAEAPALRALLEAPPKYPGAKSPGANSPLAAHVLVLPHHGSARSLTPGFYEAVKPTVALAACGYANQWGFPSPEVREALRDLDIPLYSTADAGQIRIVWSNPDAPPEIILTRAEESGEK